MFIFKFLCMSLLVIYILQLTTVHTQVSTLVSTPALGAGFPFTTKCRNPTVKEFVLRATCKDLHGNDHITRKNFRRCIFNYNGQLTTIKQNIREFYTRNCHADDAGINLLCQCQQPTPGDGYSICSLPLDSVFFSNIRGRLTC